MEFFIHVYHLCVVGQHKRNNGGNAKIGEKDDDECQIDTERDGFFGVLGLFSYKWLKVLVRKLRIKPSSSTWLPVEAIESKPTKAKKHFAAPAITPAKPYGKNPPVPRPSGT